MGSLRSNHESVRGECCGLWGGSGRDVGSYGVAMRVYGVIGVGVEELCGSCGDGGGLWGGCGANWGVVMEGIRGWLWWGYGVLWGAMGCYREIKGRCGAVMGCCGVLQCGYGVLWGSCGLLRGIIGCYVVLWGVTR